METDQCEGCTLYSKYPTRCRIRNKGYLKKCPCITCIVQVMCKQSCDEHLIITIIASQK